MIHLVYPSNSNSNSHLLHVAHVRRIGLKKRKNSPLFGHKLCYSATCRFTCLHLAEVKALHHLNVSTLKASYYSPFFSKVTQKCSRKPKTFLGPEKTCRVCRLHGPDGIGPNRSQLSEAMCKLAFGIVASPSASHDGL